MVWNVSVWLSASYRKSPSYKNFQKLSKNITLIVLLIMLQYKKLWADEPEMIEAKYREIQELYPQIGFSIGKTLSGLLTKQA